VAADQNLEILPVEKDSTKIALIWLAITLYAMEGFLRVEKSRVDGSRLNRVEEESFGQQCCFMRSKRRFNVRAFAKAATANNQ
jgi:hypothetical protein